MMALLYRNIPSGKLTTLPDRGKISFHMCPLRIGNFQAQTLNLPKGKLGKCNYSNMSPTSHHPAGPPAASFLDPWAQWTMWTLDDPNSDETP